MSIANSAEAPKKAPELQLVCFCHGVPESEIRKVIVEGARTIAEIQAKTLASTGCGGCACEVERILDEMNAAKSS